MPKNAKRKLCGSTAVVCWHPETCHHCGYHGGGIPSQVCLTCDVQAHDGCLQINGQCDVCKYGENGICRICEQVDGPWNHKQSTDRLAKKLVCVEWKETSVPGTRLVERSTPDGSSGDYVENGSGFLVAHPVFVHSWCAQCIFQTTDVTYDMLKNIEHLQRKTCVLCKTQVGCTVTCCISKCSYASSHFHPSCGVWAGMKRYSTSKGSGMVCCNHDSLMRRKIGLRQAHPVYSDQVAALAGMTLTAQGAGAAGGIRGGGPLVVTGSLN